MDIEGIKHLNYCKFTINGLLDAVTKWKVNEASYFEGPFTFLLVCYMDQVVEYTIRSKYLKKFPILSCWDDKMVRVRVRAEEK